MPLPIFHPKSMPSTQILHIPSMRTYLNSINPETKINYQLSSAWAKASPNAAPRILRHPSTLEIQIFNLPRQPTSTSRRRLFFFLRLLMTPSPSLSRLNISTASPPSLTRKISSACTPKILKPTHTPIPRLQSPQRGGVTPVSSCSPRPEISSRTRPTSPTPTDPSPSANGSKKSGSPWRNSKKHERRKRR